jgi:2-keto-4-pentenoate hydratase/2-oxohepta-3-ene-1,7-dioic acid hydratase in catechol pathway
MRLARLGEPGHEIPALVTDEATFDLRSVVADINADAVSPASLDKIRAAAARGLPELVDAGSLRIGTPIARPGAILCIGLNYVGHARESKAELPENPIVFLKSPSSLGGPNDPVDIPRGSSKTDWEVELGVVIGSRALYLDSPEDAAVHIAGYLTANDISERDFQVEHSGGQWSKGKSAPGFCPLGPWLVTRDDVDATDLRLRSWVNGELRQDSSTIDLIFGVDKIIWDLSQHFALEPGDVILTGTPEGVAGSGRFPFLTAGDVVEVEVEGLGRQRQVFRQA